MSYREGDSDDAKSHFWTDALGWVRGWAPRHSRAAGSLEVCAVTMASGGKAQQRGRGKEAVGWSSSPLTALFPPGNRRQGHQLRVMSGENELEA